ncbi:MAG: hypothetical protein JNM17_15060 [Archangium sp.]|nr:hypothetical protein [Archangium sp.]
MRGLVVLLALTFVACGAPVPLPDGGNPDAGAFSEAGFDLNDVSWLMPLPAPSDHAALLGLDSSSTRGPLLPRALYDALPGLIEMEDAALTFPKYRVISIRVDPCFPATASGCLKQIRLVAQPLVVENLQTTTEDGAIHLFFELSDADWTDVRSTLESLRTSANGATAAKPLDIHPVMASEGLRGPYATALHAMVKRLCGQQNLKRVAFMRLVQRDVAWRFGALNVENGALVADTIPRLSANTLEQGVQEFGNTDFRSGELQPEAIGDTFPTLLSESELRLTDQRTFDRAVTAALRIEHPARSNPKTMDCGSCHTASRSLRNAKKERPVDLSAHEDRFVANPRFDVRRVDGAGDDPRAMRAFGYFGRLSALSQRTINETAEIAEALSQRP